jgi:hypothetical protein
MSKYHKNPKAFDADPETYGRFLIQCSRAGIKVSFAINEALRRWTTIMERRKDEEETDDRAKA